MAAGPCGPKGQAPRKGPPPPHPQTQAVHQDPSIKKMERAKQADVLWTTNALLGIVEVSYVWKLMKQSQPLTQRNGNEIQESQASWGEQDDIPRSTDKDDLSSLLLK